MKEIIFDGHCDICGYHRSALSLGIAEGIGVDGLLGLMTGLHHMIGALMIRTHVMTALAFGDEQFAEERLEALEELTG